jgi:hypothetical protein
LSKRFLLSLFFLSSNQHKSPISQETFRYQTAI